MLSALETMGRSVRFSRGVRAFLRAPLDPSAVMGLVDDEHRCRTERFLSMLDRLVWPEPTSPWLRFFSLVGAERDDVTRLVTELGLDGALAHLRDLGVYLSTEEAQGQMPVRRGSTTFTVQPHELFNHSVRSDFIAGTSGTRSAGTPVAVSFPALKRMAVNLHLTAEMWDVVDRPTALWRPALPGSGGIIALLSSAVAGQEVERWFSQLDPRDRGIRASKRLANRLLPLVAPSARLPRAVHTPTTDPSAVLAWCMDALARSDRAALNVYPSSALRLTHAAEAAGARLDGLVLRLVGEPVSSTKASAIRASGAEPMNAYAFTQQGAVATACPHLPDEELHLFEHEMAVIQRRRARLDGVAVDALLWTNVSSSARSVWINVENDDYGVVEHDGPACPCVLGTMGMRTRLSRIRGMSKAVAGGITMPPSAVDTLVEQVLPSCFGGNPADWQLAEGADRRTSYLEIRADPRLGPLDEGQVVRTALDALRVTEAGVLAGSVWSEPGFIRVVRRSPAPARSGKTLGFEPLRPDVEASPHDRRSGSPRV